MLNMFFLINLFEKYLVQSWKEEYEVRMRYLVPNPRQKVADTEFVRSLEHKKVSFKWTRRSLGCSESCGGGTCFAILCSEISVWVGFLFHNILRPYFIEAMPTPSKQRPTSLCVSERAKEWVIARVLKLASYLLVTVKNSFITTYAYFNE